jgi:D-alanyl-D-alanine carboxypeptidase (penicillin-binding protein 5/6)
MQYLKENNVILLKAMRNFIAPVIVVLLILLLPGRMPGMGYGNGIMSSDTTGTLRIKKSNEFSIAIDSTLGYSDKYMRAGLIYDVNTNTVVWQKQMKTQVPIASLTKMMVALITIEDIKAGIIDWKTPVTVTKEASLVMDSRVFLKEGAVVTVEDLFEAAMIRSGNDAAFLLAQWGCGTEEYFVQRMNERAQELGMKNTRYWNSNGLPGIQKGNKDNYSTAEDLLILAREALKHDEYIEISSREKEVIHNGYNQLEYENRNKLVKYYKNEIDGLKTGYTKNAKTCIVATSKRCDHRVISIVLGVESSTTRNDIAVNMFNNYYKSIGLGVLGQDLEPVIVDECTEESTENGSN